jgi:hypothetical protein
MGVDGTRSRISSFEDLARLTTGELRTLLAADHATHRVWAIWALAMRAAQASHLADLIGHVAREPNAGVRRALVVVLAGHGELDLVIALGRHDPSVEVRAHAMQLATRLATGGMIAPAVIRDQLARASPEVRAAMLGAIAAGAPAWLAQLAQDALEDREADVQLEAFEATLRLGGAARLAGVRSVARRAEADQARPLWTRALNVLPAGELIAMLLGEPVELRRNACTSLPVPIDQLEPLTTPGDRQIWRALHERPAHEGVPIELAARAILDGYAIHYLDQLVGISQIRSPQLASLTPVLVELRRYCAQRSEALERGAARLADEPADAPNASGPRSAHEPLWQRYARVARWLDGVRSRAAGR